MRPILISFFLVVLASLFMSAKVDQPAQTASSNLPAVENVQTTIECVYKPNFMERLLWKRMLKQQPPDTVAADKDARTAQTLGLISVFSFFVPFIGQVASTVTAFMAISAGNRAIRNNTTQPRKAKTGKTLGIITLIAWLVAIVVVVSFFIALGGGFK